MMHAPGRYVSVLAFVSFLLWGQVPLADEAPVVTPFSSSDQKTGIPGAWQPLTFPKISTLTQYRAVQRNHRTVIQARSQGGASGLVHALDMDPARFPWLVWRWQVDHALEGADITTKAGDDCAARIYVTFKYDGGSKSWWERLKHKTARVFAGHELPGSALVYVWTGSAQVGSIIDSPYTHRSKMIVVQSGNDLKGRWISERRNIVEDYRLAFGASPPAIMGIAIMTDTDNTGGETTAYYGDILLER